MRTKITMNIDIITNNYNILNHKRAQSTLRTINYLISNTIQDIINITPNYIKYKIIISFEDYFYFKISTNYFCTQNKNLIFKKSINELHNMPSRIKTSYIDLIHSKGGRFYNRLHINKSGHMKLCASFTIPFNE